MHKLSKRKRQTSRKTGTQSHRACEMAAWLPKGDVFMKFKRFTISVMLILVITLVLTPLASSSVIAAKQVYSVDIDTGSISSGLLKVKSTDSGGTKLKVIVSKDGRNYIYNLRTDDKYEGYPLQMGEGKYSISIYENVRDNLYKEVTSTKIDVDIASSECVYLNPVQNVRWDSSSKAAAKARELVGKITMVEDKIKAIYWYIVNNVRYDREKLKRLYGGYLPDADNTLSTGSGICYDHASLFAVMLRSVGVPVKLVMGNMKNSTSYHAWNEVYIGSQKKWAVVDTSYDAQLKAKGRLSVSSIFKSAADYVSAKVY